MNDATEFDRIIDIGNQMHDIFKDIVSDTAKHIAEGYQDTAPRLSGFMADSAYYTTSEESTYGQAGAPPKGATLLPEVDKPENDLEAYASVAASYATYVEFGTRYQGAQPRFYPAIDKMWGEMQQELESVESRLGG